MINSIFYMSARRQMPVSQGFTHRRAPEHWHDGFPLGNGFLGAMLWGSGNPLNLTLDCADLWDLRLNSDFMNHPDYNYAGLRRLVKERRFDEAKEIFETRERNENPMGPTKISIGRAELALGPALDYECRLDLNHALVAGVIRTVGGNYDLVCFVHRRLPVLCLHLGGGVVNGELQLKPMAEINESLAKLTHPAPQRRSEGDLRIFIQSIPEGPHYVLVWNAQGPDYFLALALAEDTARAEAKARAAWQEAAQAGFDRLRREHERLWKKFWAVSAVYLPEERIEFFWRYGIYLLASSARRGSYPPGLQGVWAMDGRLPPWRGDYHADLNVQETFWPAAATGHLDLLDSWCDNMKKEIAAAQAFTRRFFGVEGAFWRCAMLPNYTTVSGWYTVQFALSNPGFLGWLVWLRWRHSIDMAWLRDTGYPLIAGIFKFYRGILEPGVDGYLHVPLSTTPEYIDNMGAAWCVDPNIDLALIRRCCDWIVEMEAALALNELSAAARDVRARLTPYALTENRVLCLWPGHPLDESHRHPSHLMAIHPAMDLTIEGDEQERAIINASIRHYQSLGQAKWGGHTYAQLISMAAVLGRSAWAYDSLRQFVEHWTAPNGLHFNSDWRGSGASGYSPPLVKAPFTLEANCAVMAGICDMLVQGWRDIVRVFPAVPEHWRDIAFRDLVTEGAFKVSGIRRAGKTVWVQVVAGVQRTLRLRDPFQGQPVKISGVEARRDNDLWIADLKPGEKIILAVGETDVDWRQVIRSIHESDTTWLGLR
jgi:alpha-L-fucosidase 2